MAYPQALWTLQGYAIQTVQLIDIEQVRPLIPSELEIVSIWPGKTVGGVYLSYYGSGSVLEYSELIVVAGVVSYSRKRKALPLQGMKIVSQFAKENVHCAVYATVPKTSVCRCHSVAMFSVQ